MKYMNKNTIKNIERMKNKFLKKSINNMKEISIRNSFNPDAGNNTRIQKSGMGKVSNSHAKRIGSILNSDAADKTLENIDKIYNPEEKNKVKNKIVKMKKDRDSILKEETIGFFEDNGLKVFYNNNKISYSSFISKPNSKITSILKFLMSLKKKEKFEGSLSNFLIKKINSLGTAVRPVFEIKYKDNNISFKEV